MRLSEAAAGRFFNLMGRLQHHVNRRLGLIPGEVSPEAYSELPPSQRAKVRDALWKDPGAIDAYVAENPDNLPAEELAIVERWKRFESGTFQIVRLLKRHAVFVRSDSRVYAVLALHDPFEDLLLGRPLPVAVTAVLLPFEGKIVYDGFLGLYNVTFGPGIRRNLHETYMKAKQSGSILETLEPEEARPRPSERPRRAGRRGQGKDRPEEGPRSLADGAGTQLRSARRGSLQELRQEGPEWNHDGIRS